MNLHYNAKDLTGNRFGKLTVLRPTGARRDNKLVWECLCDCGQTTYAVGPHMKSGSVLSCGCLRSDVMRSNLEGQRFGRWTVLSYTKKSRWLCRCDCGVESNVLTSNLTSGASTSCGCYREEMNRTHGLSGLREYKIWSAMRDRCGNPKRNSYEHYGGRGIRVCARWESFEAFLADVGLAPTNRHSLDRINNHGNYEPGNVRWATTKEQLANRRPTKEIILTRMTVAELRTEIARKEGRLGIFG